MLPHAPRPRTPSSDAETFVIATSLLRRKSAAREDCGWPCGGGKALLQAIHRGTLHGVPLPQLDSVTSALLCASKRPLSPAHCWFTAIASVLEMMGHTLNIYI